MGDQSLLPPTSPLTPVHLKCYANMEQCIKINNVTISEQFFPLKYKIFMEFFSGTQFKQLKKERFKITFAIFFLFEAAIQFTLSKNRMELDNVIFFFGKKLSYLRTTVG
jgi:hypothetical protein